MAKEITQAELLAAIEAFCAKEGWSNVEYPPDSGQYNIQMEGDGIATVGIEDGKFKCTDEKVGTALEEIIKENRESPPKEAAKGSNLPVKLSQQGNTPDTMKKAENKNLVKPGGFSLGITGEDIIHYLNPKATEAEAGLFLKWCERKGFDPIKKQAYLVVYEGKNGRQANHIVAVDTFNEIAEKNLQFDGYQGGIIVKNAEGKIERREGTFKLDDEELLGGWCDVYRKDRKFPYKIEVSLKEYDKKRNTWLEIPCTMINKVAIVQALRKAFPTDLGGCYDASEMGVDPEKEIQQG